MKWEKLKAIFSTDVRSAFKEQEDGSLSNDLDPNLLEKLRDTSTWNWHKAKENGWLIIDSLQYALIAAVILGVVLSLISPIILLKSLMFFTVASSLLIVGIFPEEQAKSWVRSIFSLVMGLVVGPSKTCFLPFIFGYNFFYNIKEALMWNYFRKKQNEFELCAALCLKKVDRIDSVQDDLKLETLLHITQIAVLHDSTDLLKDVLAKKTWEVSELVMLLEVISITKKFSQSFVKEIITKRDLNEIVQFVLKNSELKVLRKQRIACLVIEAIDPEGLSILDEKDQEGSTLLHIAAANGYFMVVDELLKKGARANEKDREGRTPLHLVMINNVINHDVFLPVVGLLLAAGADVDARDGNGQTALHFAAHKGDENAVHELIKIGADFNAKNQFEQTALHIATANGSAAVVSVLIGQGADMRLKDYKGRTPLHLAAHHGQAGPASELIKKDPDGLRVQDKSGFTPIMGAVRSHHANIVELLINHGGDVNAIFNSKLHGMRLLHLAARENDRYTVQVLIKHHAHLNIQDDSGRTPIHYAAYEGHAHV